MANQKRSTVIPDNINNETQEQNVSEIAEASNTMALIQNEAQQNADKLALELHYDGALTIGALEDEIRFYQRRTVEACLEFGKRLLILKELTPHGEFKQRIELLGIDNSLANKFMKAAFKFSKVETFPVLKIGAQSKLLELIALDDGEIDALENGDSVRGLTIDSIETMSVSELKKALRYSKETLQAKDAVIRNKTEDLDKKAEQIAILENRVRSASPDELMLDARNRLQNTAAAIKATIMTELRKALKDLHDHPGDHQTIAASMLIEVSRELAMLRGEYLLPETVTEDPMPAWLDQAAIDEINGLAEA